MAGKKGIYLPPVTEKGLIERIEKFLKDSGHENTLTIIKGDKQLYTVWQLAIQLSYAHMGGTKLEGSKEESVTKL